MRILLVSQYFPPEVGATQNRMESFARGLQGRGHEVTVVCEQPNHPAGVFAAGYGRRPWATGRLDGASVHRLWVATSPRKTAARRAAFYGTFAAGAFAATTVLARHDVVFVTSPPLPGALGVALAGKARRVPYVLDVRDLWPAAAEALGELSQPRLLALLERAERWLYRGARAVTATTEPFCAHIDDVAGRQVAVHLPNGALDELVERPHAETPDGPFTVGYAGNLGIAQGLGSVLDAAGRLRDEGVRFLLLGDGPLATELRGRVEREGLDNVELRPGVPVGEVGPILESCHALLVPLRDHRVFDDFIPSKLYDAMAVGRPAIVAARGLAAELVQRTGAGVAVAPEDPDALAAAVRRVLADPGTAAELGRAGKRAAADMSRSRQVERLEQVLLEAAG